MYPVLRLPEYLSESAVECAWWVGLLYEGKKRLWTWRLRPSKYNNNLVLSVLMCVENDACHFFPGHSDLTDMVESYKSIGSHISIEKHNSILFGGLY